MLFAATWIELEVIVLSAASQTERKTSFSITYMKNLKKKGYRSTYLQNRNRLLDLKTNLWL